MPRPRNTSSPLFALVAALAIVAALYFAKAVLLPLALAILLSFLLTPLANRLERWKLPRVLSVIVVAGFAFAVIGLVTWIVTIQVIDLSLKLPTYKDRVVAKVDDLTQGPGPIGRAVRTIHKVANSLSERSDAETEPKEAGDGKAAATRVSPSRPTVEPAAGGAPDAVEVKVISNPQPLEQIRDWLGPLVSPLATTGLVIVLVIFILMQREDQRNRLIELFGSGNLHLTTEALTDAAGRVMRYLRMQFMVNAGYGFCVAIALWVLGVPNAVMWGVLSFLLRFLPYIGPWIAASMPIALSVAVSEGWGQPLMVVASFVILELVVNNFLEPWVYGSSIGVSAVGIIVAAIFWTWLWGPIGLVLAMPLTVCLVVIARYVPQLRFVTVLFGDEPALSAAERTYQRLLAMDDNEVRQMARREVKNAPLVDYYDGVLIPALMLAERDRHAGILNEEQEDFVIETAEDLVEELAASAPAGERKPGADAAASAESKESAPPTARVLCVPLRDRADRTCTLMLGQILSADGFHVDIGSAESLTNEIVNDVESLKSEIVVISILPPCSPRNSRLLCRRLHARYPKLAVIVGYWNAVTGENFAQRFELGEQGHFVTSLEAASAAVRKEAARMRTGADGPHTAGASERGTRPHISLPAAHAT